MKKIPNWIIASIVIALIIISKYIFFPSEDKNTNNKSNSKNGAPVAANYFIAQTGIYTNNIFATGKIGAINQIQLLPEVNGKITNILFQEGQQVTKGQALVKLNDADLQAQLLKLKTQITLSEQKLERLKKLLSINGISQEDYDSQENEVNSIKADIALVTAQLAKTTITAPFNGTIGLKNVSEGSFINTSTPIATLVQTKPLYVEFSVPEKYFSILKKGTVVKFSADQNNDNQMQSASIYAIEPNIDEVTKTIKARAMYQGNSVFYPGTFAKVFTDIKTDSNTIMIPTQCLISTLKGQKVFVVKNGVANEIEVNIGVRTDDKIQITDGIHTGDTILSSGLMGIKNDSKVKLIKEVK